MKSAKNHLSFQPTSRRDTHPVRRHDKRWQRQLLLQLFRNHSESDGTQVTIALVLCVHRNSLFAQGKVYRCEGSLRWPDILDHRRNAN